jgi:hypothetical protein
MENFDAILNLADKIGVMAGGILLGIALHKKMLVLGWTYAECQSRLETCGTIATGYATKIEAKLERLEAQREKQNAPPA